LSEVAETACEINIDSSIFNQSIWDLCSFVHNPGGALRKAGHFAIENGTAATVVLNLTMVSITYAAKLRKLPFLSSILACFRVFAARAT
jgi:hypothetical protein